MLFTSTTLLEFFLSLVVFANAAPNAAPPGASRATSHDPRPGSERSRMRLFRNSNRPRSRPPRFRATLIVPIGPDTYDDIIAEASEETEFSAVGQPAEEIYEVRRVDGATGTSEVVSVGSKQDGNSSGDEVLESKSDEVLESVSDDEVTEVSSILDARSQDRRGAQGRSPAHSNSHAARMGYRCGQAVAGWVIDVMTSSEDDAPGADEAIVEDEDENKDEVEVDALSINAVENATVTRPRNHFRIRRFARVKRSASRPRRAHLAHEAMNTAISRVVKHCERLELLFAQRDWWDKLDIQQQYYHQALSNVLIWNQQRMDDLQAMPRLPLRRVARQITKLYTPLYSLRLVLQKVVGKNFQSPDGARHAIWLRKRVPEVLVNEIFEFAGINKVLFQTQSSVDKALETVSRVTDWHPSYAYEKIVLKRHKGTAFFNSDGSFDWSRCNEYYCIEYCYEPCYDCVCGSRFFF